MILFLVQEVNTTTSVMIFVTIAIMFRNRIITRKILLLFPSFLAKLNPVRDRITQQNEIDVNNSDILSRSVISFSLSVVSSASQAVGHLGFEPRNTMF